jgi:hypothetical protein
MQKVLYKAEYCDQLIDHMRTGLSLMAFGGVVGVSVRTLHKWKNKYPDFQEAYEIGQAAVALHLEKLGYDMMAHSPSVKVEPAIWIFNARNRLGWSDNPHIDDGTEEPYEDPR